MLALLSLSTSTQRAQAAYPGVNGKISFYTNRDGNTEIYVMNADGTNQTRLTTATGDDYNVAWSADGSKLAFNSIRDGNNEIYTMNFDGSGQTNITNNSGHDVNPYWSPDGSKIVFETSRDGNNEIYIMNADGTGLKNITNDASGDISAAWSPDGTKIAFNSNRSGNHEIYTMNIDGSNLTRLTNLVGVDDRADWSPDGTKIVWHSSVNGNNDIWVMNADGSNQTRLTTNAASDLAPVFSPDGTKILFQTNRDGTFQLYKMNLDGSDQTRLISTAFIDEGPNWQPLRSPRARADTASTTTNQAVTLSVLANDTDTYNALNPASVTITAAPTHGTTSVNATTGAINYTPTQDYAGSDGLTYQVCSTYSSLCTTASVTITITVPAPTPDTTAPSAPRLTKIGTLTTSTNGTQYYYTGHRPTFSGTAEPGSTITLVIHSDPITLTTTTNASGTWSIKPTQDIPDGDHTIIISAKDAAGNNSAEVTTHLGINTGIAATGQPVPLVNFLSFLSLLGACYWLKRYETA